MRLVRVPLTGSLIANTPFFWVVGGGGVGEARWLLCYKALPITVQASLIWSRDASMTVQMTDYILFTRNLLGYIWQIRI